MPIRIFCSYAHKDKKLLKELRKHLSPLEKQGVIAVWDDSSIEAGVEWEQELKKHLNTAHIILLLISGDFMASDCYHSQMEHALERHDRGEARVIPIILRPVAWQHAPFAKLQVLPTDRRPITTWDNLDKAFHEVTGDLARIIAKIDNKPKSSKAPQELPALKCMVDKREELEYGFVYEFTLKDDIKEHNLKLVVNYGWGNTLYLDGMKIFQKQKGYFDSILTSIEAYIEASREEFEYPIFECNFIVDGHSLEYFYYCKKIRSRSIYKILIEMEGQVLFEKKGYY